MEATAAPSHARRDRLDIWADILLSVRAADARGGRALRPTRLQSVANLPHDRFWEHVAELEARGLLKREPMSVTRLGDEFLSHADRMRAFVSSNDASEPFKDARVRESGK